MHRTLSLLALALILPASLAKSASLSRNILARGSLDNSRIRFEKEKLGRIAFIGGSITEMNGYRPLVSQWLKQRFPETRLQFIDAGIASTCSTTGAFRLKSDVLDHGPIHLFFIEFAVNDDQDAAHTRRDCIRGMEGIIRQTLQTNPGTDIIVTYFVNPGMLKQIQEGKTPLAIEAHEMVLKHYSIPAIYLAREVADRISAGSLTWDDYGGTHPGKPGNTLAASLIADLLSDSWNKPLPPDAVPAPHEIPATPLDSQSYVTGHFLSPERVAPAAGWHWEIPDWKSIPGDFRTRFAGQKLLTSTNAGATTTLAFQGRAIGAYVLAGPDAGMVETRIDGGPARTTDLFHQFSKGLHYPRTVLFHTDLPPGEHTLTLRVSPDHNPGSQGHGIRILQFAVD